MHLTIITPTARITEVASLGSPRRRLWGTAPITAKNLARAKEALAAGAEVREWSDGTATLIIGCGTAIEGWR